MFGGKLFIKKNMRARWIERDRRKRRRRRRDDDDFKDGLTSCVFRVNDDEQPNV
jgi:hypothetical protein